MNFRTNSSLVRVNLRKIKTFTEQYLESEEPDKDRTFKALCLNEIQEIIDMDLESEGIREWLNCIVDRYLSGLILLPTLLKSKRLNLKIGDVGEVVSVSRPAGKAKFGDAIVDVVTEAEFFDKGTKVGIIKIQGSKVVVRYVL